MSSTALKLAAPFSRDALHDYQHRAMSFLKEKPKCALWMDLGLGKSITTLTAIADLYERFQIARVLIIAPPRVALHTWPSEVVKWDHTAHLKVQPIAGTPAKRQAILENPSAPIQTISRDLVTWLVGQCGKKWPFDMVVIDESSSFKSRQAKRFKAMKKVLPFIDRMVELTGTPASNGLMDIWPQIFMLDKGERLGRTITSYRQTYFTQDFHGFSWTLNKGSSDIIHTKVADICLTLRAEDYLKMPKRFDHTVEVELPPAARKAYSDLEKHFLTEIEDETITVFNAAARTGKLLQFANGAVYTDEERNWKAVHDAKLDALGELIEGANGQPALVAYNFKTDLARILERFPKAEVIGNDPEIIDRWNAGEVPILVAHPQSAGHGLNLQQGGNTIIWFGLNWSLELYQQFNARLHRQGQTKPVMIHHIVTKNSVDETVLAALESKDVTQSALLDALKEDVGSRNV